MHDAQLTPFATGWSTWFAGYGGAGETDGDPVVAGTHNVNAHIYGVAAGADYRFTPTVAGAVPDMVLGGALGWGNTSWSISQALGTGGSDAIQAAVYGAARSGPAYATGALVFADNWVTTNRIALGDHLLGRYTAHGIGGRVEGGYRFAASPDFGLTPYIAGQAQDFEAPAYKETDVTGGGFGLSFASSSPTAKQGELGLRFDDEGMLVGDTPIVIRGRAAWAHDWGNAPVLDASFQALPGASFLVKGAKLPSDSALGSLSFELPLSSGLSFRAGVDGRFANGAETVTGSGSLRFAW